MAQKPVLRVGVLARVARESKHNRGGKAGAVAAGTRRGRCGRRASQLPFCGARPRERGAAWPCCEGRRAGVQRPFLSVEDVHGMLLEIGSSLQHLKVGVLL